MSSFVKSVSFEFQAQVSRPLLHHLAYFHIESFKLNSEGAVDLFSLP